MFRVELQKGAWGEAKIVGTLPGRQSKLQEKVCWGCHLDSHFEGKTWKSAQKQCQRRSKDIVLINPNGATNQREKRLYSQTLVIQEAGKQVFELRRKQVKDGWNFFHPKYIAKPKTFRLQGQARCLKETLRADGESIWRSGAVFGEVKGDDSEWDLGAKVGFGERGLKISNRFSEKQRA